MVSTQPHFLYSGNRAQFEWLQIANQHSTDVLLTSIAGHFPQLMNQWRILALEIATTQRLI